MQINMRGPAGRYNSPYGGIATFLRQDYCDDIATLDADYAILGTPTDEGSPFMGGSRFAPRSIREHSLRFGSDGYYDILTDKSYLVEETANRRIVDVGGQATSWRPNVERTFEQHYRRCLRHPRARHHAGHNRWRSLGDIPGGEGVQ